jgi:mycofactocin precursor
MALRAVIVPGIDPRNLGGSGAAASYPKETGMADAPVVDDVEDVADLVEDETLVEEVSIDGMCGVY